MREIGSIKERLKAKKFSDFLLVEGIENRIDEEDSAWTIWIISEDKVKKAIELFNQYEKDPKIIDSKKVMQKAFQIREKEKQEETAYKKLMEKSRVKFSSASGVGRLTRILIFISLAVALISQLGSNWQVLRFISIADYEIIGDTLRWMPGLIEVFHGQIWRLITPIFIHYGFIHILFNMYWLYYLGSQIENIQGIKSYVWLILALAIIPNVCQFYATGPSFGGMSGVNYGLMGYIWIREKFDPNSGLHIENYIVVMMMIWFFLGLTGLIGSIANVVHGMGLVVGMVWGYILSRSNIVRR